MAASVERNVRYDTQATTAKALSLAESHEKQGLRTIQPCSVPGLQRVQEGQQLGLLLWSEFEVGGASRRRFPFMPHDRLFA